jgi:hypothetical protein
MVQRLAGIALSLLSTVASAATYTVTNTNDAGVGSLRQAILNANAHAGADSIIFAAALNGETISPLSGLPTLTDASTSISASVDADAGPDVLLDGELLAEGNGLSIAADGCEVRALAIVRFPSAGIAIGACTGCRVQGCHIGVNLPGTAAWPNRGPGIGLYEADDNVIGGTSSRTRNIIATGLESSDCGIWVFAGNDNAIVGNYVGLRRNGSAAVGSGKYGIIIQGSGVQPSARNRIGGSDPGAGNLFGGLRVGMQLRGATDTTVVGNTFGLAVDGDTVVPIESACAWLWEGTTGSQIGGTAAAARNVFVADGAYGLRIFGEGTASNRVQGNYFGTNVAGTAERGLSYGISIYGGAGAQTIGGSDPGAGNVFTPSTAFDTGIAISITGQSGTSIRGNTFGRLPSGVDTTSMGDALHLTDSLAQARDNVIRRATHAGVYVTGAAALPTVIGNEFRRCDRAVWIANGARCKLGNLANVSTADDGDNLFRLSARTDITNDTSNYIRAEGNDFGTTDRDTINGRIVDRLDNPALGRVDFEPLSGGVAPTGEAGAVVVSGATAVPTARGAEIAFSLSAPGEVTVTVLNLAGRPVATVTQSRAMGAGLQRLAWNGQSAAGTQVPAGAYLVSVEARDASGRRTRAVARLSVTR